MTRNPMRFFISRPAELTPETVNGMRALARFVINHGELIGEGFADYVAEMERAARDVLREIDDK